MNALPRRPRRDASSAAERGVALPVALVTMLLLAMLAVGLAEVTEAELDVGRLTRWDLQAQYLAQAGVEDQLYLLKFDKNAAMVAATNYPVTAGQEFWYFVEMGDYNADGTPEFCVLQCGVDREHRRWIFVATGEIRQAGSGAPTPGSSCTVPCLQRRSIRVVVEISYAWGLGANALTGFYLPREVTFIRWEEVYP